MGLDNGFVVHGLKHKDIPSFVTLPMHISEHHDNSDTVEIAYYRKCWGLRDAILGVLHAHHSGGDFRVEAEDIPAIINVIRPFFSEEYWNDEGDSIWSFAEAFNYMLVQQTINLQWLHSYMTVHPEVTCYFYDSY